MSGSYPEATGGDAFRRPRSMLDSLKNTMRAMQEARRLRIIEQSQRDTIKRFMNVEELSCGMNKTVMVIIDKASKHPLRQGSPLDGIQGLQMCGSDGSRSHKWSLMLKFGTIPEYRASPMQKPVLVAAKPQFALDGMTFDVDTAEFIVSSPIVKGEYGAPSTDISLNPSKKPSDGKEFESGVLNGTSEPTRAVIVQLDSTGAVSSVYMARNDTTDYVEVEPSSVGNLSVMLDSIVGYVRATNETFHRPPLDFALEDITNATN